MHSIKELRTCVCAALVIAGNGLTVVAAPAAPEAKPKHETLLTVGIVQIALMTLSAHVGAYGTVEQPAASAAAGQTVPGGLIVEAKVPADDAPALKLDRPVEIATNLANSKVIGKLISVAPRIDERTGTVAVRVSVPPNSGFLPGQFVKLSIATAEHANIVSVPVESLVKDPDVGYVISIVNGDIETQKPVRVGIRDGDFVEVEGEGVAVGMTVVSSGAYALPRQSKVHVITPLD